MRYLGATILGVTSGVIAWIIILFLRRHGEPYVLWFIPAACLTYILFSMDKPRKFEFFLAAAFRVAIIAAAVTAIIFFLMKTFRVNENTAIPVIFIGSFFLTFILDVFIRENWRSVVRQFGTQPEIQGNWAKDLSRLTPENRAAVLQAREALELGRERQAVVKMLEDMGISSKYL